VRGGYQISYIEPDNASTIEGIIGNAPGSTNNATYTPSTYLDLAHMESVIPAPPTAQPMAAVPLTDRLQTISVYDPNFLTPYIQNMTLSVTRNIGSRLTVNIRYIGTLSRKMVTSFNLNTPNFLTNGLKEAFDAARYGDDSNPAAALLDKIFDPLRGSQSGAQFLRSTTSYPLLRSNLANGNYQFLATRINNIPQPYVASTTLTNGYLLRNAGLPENFIVTNPQFGAVNLRSNWGTANYNAMQAQVEMRPAAGFSFQLSYTWSKNLGNLGSAGYTDPRNLKGDYTVLDSDRRHALTSYGTYELPIGPKKRYFSKSEGFLARVLESWQANWIATLAGGNPINVTGQTTLFGVGIPDQVGPFPFDKMGVYWKDGSREGNYFANSLKIVDDPQGNKDGSRSGFGIVTSKDNLNGAYSMTAIADANGSIILQNALPGTRGSFGFNRFYGPLTWNLDMSINKSVKISESKSVSVRIDSTNIFNHPQPSGALNTASTRIYYASPPIATIDTTNPYFGTFATKVGSRVFQARIRFSF
jgi:hypothetical protein